MSGVRRFLSRKERSPHRPHRLHKDREKDTADTDASSTVTAPTKPPEYFHGVYVLPKDHKRPDKDEERKIKGILERLRTFGVGNITEANVEYAIRARSAQGNPEVAFRLLMLLQHTYEGIVRAYDPAIRLVGAINRDAVSCYLDSLLFGMFFRLDSFEAMLYDHFSDPKRRRLAGLLRLWVNLLRTGRLITVDITAQLQGALAECGWTEAGTSRQQDPSEAFTFITGQLELPMLTLKMDMFHTGKEDPQDDHKFVNERLLEVAIIESPVDGKNEVTLEDCLEHYFNNRIEVKRHLENQRRNTLKSAQTQPLSSSPTKAEKENGGSHIEILEIPETPLGTPNPGSTPFTEYPPTPGPKPPSNNPLDRIRPSLGRTRGNSIFSQRTIALTGIDPSQLPSTDLADPRSRKMSTRTEVLMPAWQFFKLLPWYAENRTTGRNTDEEGSGGPTSDAQVAAHFSQQRPVLGICLKRYSYTLRGEARKLATFVDVPLEIAVPSFVSDENLDAEGADGEGAGLGSFGLVLQSVVCHRGVDVHSGHYVCLSRAGRKARDRRSSVDSGGGGEEGGDEEEDPWVLFDDLAEPRVKKVDVFEVLKRETPYLLFYQVQPIGGSSDSRRGSRDLPTYQEVISRSQSLDATALQPPNPKDLATSESADLRHTASSPTNPSQASTSVADFVSGPDRSSLDRLRGKPFTDQGNAEAGRRSSITLTEPLSTTSTNSNSYVNSVPSDDRAGSLLSVAKSYSNSAGGSRRGSRVSNSSNAASVQVAKSTERSQSRASDRDDTKPSSRGLSMSKLTQKLSPTATATSVGLGGGSAGTAGSSVDPMNSMANNASKESFSLTGRTVGGKLRKDERARRRAEGREERDCCLM